MYKLIASFNFIANLVLTRSVLDLTFHVTEILQEEEIDMTDSCHLLDTLTRAILSKRNTVDQFRNNCYRIILDIGNKWIINEAKPRTPTLKKKNQSHVSLESVSDYL